MSRRVAFWLAWSLAALSVASFITSIPLYFPPSWTASLGSTMPLRMGQRYTG
jgi:hypothetical protein